jgi:hypothetical protein
MKKILVLTLFSFTIFNETYSQIKSKISNDIIKVDSAAVESVSVDSSISVLFVPFSNRSILLDKNFSFGNFNFNKKWDNIKSMFSFASNSDLSEYSFEQTEDDFYFSYILKKEFENIKFDDIFLKLSKGNYLNLGFSKLIFVKKFENTNDAVDFYLKTSKYFFKINQNNFSAVYRKGGEKINLSVSLIENYVYLEVEDEIKYFNSSQIFNYKYNFLFYQFKEIDNDYSFRDIKFGTNLSTIKSFTKLDSHKNGNKYTFNPKDEKYFFWKGFDVPKGGTFFYFTKDLKLAEVSIVVQCFNDYSLDEIKTKLIKIFGSPSIKTNEEIKWVGKNITIMIPNKRDEKDYIHILISSNILDREFEKDY